MYLKKLDLMILLVMCIQYNIRLRHIHVPFSIKKEHTHNIMYTTYWYQENTATRMCTETTIPSKRWGAYLDIDN